MTSNFLASTSVTASGTPSAAGDHVPAVRMAVLDAHYVVGRDISSGFPVPILHPFVHVALSFVKIDLRWSWGARSIHVQLFLRRKCTPQQHTSPGATKQRANRKTDTLRGSTYVQLAGDAHLCFW